MLRRPRRLRYQRIFRLKGWRPWRPLPLFLGVGALQATRYLRLSWHLFELIRLRLAWGLGRRSGGGRRTWFKQGRRRAQQGWQPPRLTRRPVPRPRRRLVLLSPRPPRRRRRRVALSARTAWRARRRRQFWYTGFPHLGYSAKTKGMRMGKGKGGNRQ